MTASVNSNGVHSSGQPQNWDGKMATIWHDIHSNVISWLWIMISISFANCWFHIQRRTNSFAQIEVLNMYMNVSLASKKLVIQYKL
jgi:hypothetical protein